MRQFLETVLRLLRQEHGTGGAEWAMLACLIALAVIALGGAPDARPQAQSEPRLHWVAPDNAFN